MGVLVTGLVLVLQAGGWLGAVERRVYDYRARFCQSRVPAPPQYVHLDIDDGSLESIGPWPWPRRMTGDVLRLLADARYSLGQGESDDRKSNSPGAADAIKMPAQITPAVPEPSVQQIHPLPPLKRSNRCGDRCGREGWTRKRTRRH